MLKMAYPQGVSIATALMQGDLMRERDKTHSNFRALSFVSLPRSTVLVIIRLCRFQFQHAFLAPEFPSLGFTGARAVKHGGRFLAVITIFLPPHVPFYSSPRHTVHPIRRICAQDNELRSGFSSQKCRVITRLVSYPKDPFFLRICNA